VLAVFGGKREDLPGQAMVRASVYVLPDGFNQVVTGIGG